MLLLEVPVCMVLLMGMMELCIRHCHGITGDGIVVPVVREAEITRILVWRCVSLPVSGIPADRALPALIWRRQEHLQCGRMRSSGGIVCHAL